MFHSISSEILIWFELSSQNMISQKISLLMFLLGAFLSGPKVPKGTKSSYWVQKFLLGSPFDESEQASFSRSSASYWQNFFIKRSDIVVQSDKPKKR